MCEELPVAEVRAGDLIDIPIQMYGRSTIFVSALVMHVEPAGDKVGLDLACFVPGNGLGTGLFPLDPAELFVVHRS